MGCLWWDFYLDCCCGLVEKRYNDFIRMLILWDKYFSKRVTELEYVLHGVCFVGCDLIKNRVDEKLLIMK